MMYASCITHISNVYYIMDGQQRLQIKIYLVEQYLWRYVIISLIRGRGILELIVSPDLRILQTSIHFL